MAPLNPDSSSTNDSNKMALPLKPIPGSYGVPFFGAIKDRLDYFYNQGRDEFFASRIKNHNSTVIRTNMPPGPFIAHNPRVVALLDSVSFPVLFDNSKVEKCNVLDGTFFPSVNFTGGYRMCAFLDSSEPAHTALKSYFFSILASKHNTIMPFFELCLSRMFSDLEIEMDSKKKADFSGLLSSASFSFVFNLFTDIDPSDTPLGKKGETHVTKWLLAQLLPLATLGLPKYLEDLLFRTFPIPSLLVKSDYKKLYDAFYMHAGAILEQADRFGISKEEACHNLVFLAYFNAYGGMKGFFPLIFKWTAEAGKRLHLKLAGEVRSAVMGGELTFEALEKMALTKSVVYEALRIEPPVPYQYGKAREDMVVASHDAAFEIKKGEMIFGYQPFATRDPRVFARADEFVGDRFVGDEGEKKLKYVYWSNGRETEDPTVDNKQCPGKNVVTLLARILVAEFFLRYDTFTAESKGNGLAGANVTITYLAKKSS